MQSHKPGATIVANQEGKNALLCTPVHSPSPFLTTSSMTLSYSENQSPSARLLLLILRKPIHAMAMHNSSVTNLQHYIIRAFLNSIAQATLITTIPTTHSSVRPSVRPSIRPQCQSHPRNIDATLPTSKQVCTDQRTNELHTSSNCDTFLPGNDASLDSIFFHTPLPI